MISESNGAEILPAVHRSGVEISNAWNVTNWNSTKLRRPHRSGSDLRECPQGAPAAVAVPRLLRAQAGRVLGARQEDVDWLPHPATQKGANVVTATISSAEVSELRRTMINLQTCERQKS